MAGETILNIVGNLTADPELRHTQNGHAVANFTVAATPRTFDRQTNEWKDGDALFMRCAAWKEMGEHVAASLSKGMRVMVTGRLEQRTYQDKDNNNRTSIELTVDEIGPSLRYATAQVTRVQNGQGGQRQGGQQGQQQPQVQGNYGPPQGGAPGYGPPQGGQPPQQGYAPQGQQGPPQQQAPQQQQQQQAPQQQGYQQPPQQAAQPGTQQAAQQGQWQQPGAFGDDTPF